MFSVVLPVSTAGAGRRRAAHRDALGRRRARQTRVLYIEDNPDQHAPDAADRRPARRRDPADRADRCGGDRDSGARSSRTSSFLDLHLPDIPGETVLARLLELPAMSGVPGGGRDR